MNNKEVVLLFKQYTYNLINNNNCLIWLALLLVLSFFYNEWLVLILVIIFMIIYWMYIKTLKNKLLTKNSILNKIFFILQEYKINMSKESRDNDNNLFTLW